MNAGKIAAVILVAPLWYAISSMIGLVILLVIGEKPVGGWTAFILGSVALGAIIVISHLRSESLLESERRENATRPCPHGVAGGITIGACSTCVEARNTEEAIRQREKADAEKRRLFQEKYRQVREAEKERLRTSVMPVIGDFQNLSSQQFENAIADLYKRMGFLVEQTPYSNDGGRDAILNLDGQKYLLECKRYSDTNLVGRPEIQKFHSAIITDSAAGGFFVSTSAFTKEATEYAAKIQCVTLVRGVDLQELIFRSGNTNQDDSYSTVCLDCGEQVLHQLRGPKEQQCCCGQGVKASLSISEVLARGQQKMICEKCGANMRLVSGRNGKFWGCSKYPSCRSTKPHGPRRRRFRY